MSRETLLYAGEFLKAHGHKPRGLRYVGQHRVRPVEELPPVVDAETQELIVQLHTLGAEMRFVEDEPDVCPCTEAGGFRVYDGRRDDGRRYEELCRGCVADHVKHCRTDAVVVEVCIR